MLQKMKQPKKVIKQQIEQLQNENRSLKIELESLLRVIELLSVQKSILLKLINHKEKFI